MPATGSSTSSSRTSVSTAPWPPSPWPVGSRSRPRRRSRKRRPRRPRPSPSSSPSSSRAVVAGTPGVGAVVRPAVRPVVSTVVRPAVGTVVAGCRPVVRPAVGRLSGRLSDRSVSRGCRCPGCCRGCLSPPRLSARSRRPPRAGRPLSTDASAGASALVAASAAGASALVPASAAGATASALWPLCSARRRWRCRRPPTSPSACSAPRCSARCSARRQVPRRRLRGPQTREAVRSVPRRLGRSGSAVGGGLRVRRARGPGRGPATPVGGLPLHRFRRRRPGPSAAEVGVRQRELRGGAPARLALLDRGDEIALAHAGDVGDVQLPRQLAEFRQHHAGSPPLARCGGADELGLAQGCPS